ncbi:MAG: hypothetical protein M0P27_00605 [Bacteroidales bacterium]|nr:hypothetical protein [Bacteroidales bacterium]
MHILFLCGCMRRPPNKFEQQIREAWPQVSHCLGVVDQTGLESKTGNQRFDPVATIEKFLRSHPQYWDNPGDLFFISTNNSYWLYEKIASNDVAVLKRVVNIDNLSQVLYIGETFGLKKIVITNLIDNTIIPVNIEKQEQ